MKDSNSYSIEKFHQAEEEVRRLDRRSILRLDEMVPQLKNLGLRSNMRVLEIGSGTGTRAIHLAKFMSQGEVTGVDVTDMLINHATAKAKQQKVSNIKFLKMNALELDFTPQSFDVVYIRLVLQHTSEPKQLLQNARRVLKDGGLVFVEETDRDWLTIYPEPMGWSDVYEKAKLAQKEKGGDPRCGRKIAAYLAEVGLKNVEVNMIPVFSTGAAFKNWVEDYAPSFFNYLDLSEQEKAMSILDGMASYSRDSYSCMHQLWFQSWGRT